MECSVRIEFDGSRSAADCDALPGTPAGRGRDAERLGGAVPADLAVRAFDQGGQAMIIADARSRIVAANRAFSTMTGYRAEELVGAGTRAFAAGRTQPAFLSPAMPAAAKPSPSTAPPKALFRAVASLRTASANSFWASAQIS